MKLNVKLQSFEDTFGDRWSDPHGRAIRVRVVRMAFVLDAPPPPLGYPVEPEVLFAVGTSDADSLTGIDFGNKDQVYTIDLEPARPTRPPGRTRAEGPADASHGASAEGGAAHQKEKAPAHGSSKTGR
jgi:hypothetical protein